MFVLDLLYAFPKFRLDQATLAQTLTFAFAAGGGGDAFSRVLAHPNLEPSSLSADCFATDLFLDDFVRLYLTTSAGAGGKPNQPALRLMLGHPPQDLNTVMLRHGVLREIATRPELHQACIDAWLAIGRLRTTIESSELGKRGGTIYRRVEILRQTESLIGFLNQAFAGAESALSRISEYTGAVMASDGFQNLRQFLDYEGHLATVELSIRVGRDGEIRSLSIVRTQANSSNEHPWISWSRWWSRVVLLLRGYAIREREVIGRLVETVFDAIQEVLLSLFQLEMQVEFYLGAFRFRHLAERRGLTLSLPEFIPADEPDTRTRFDCLFNPFLLQEERPPVPCDLEVEKTEMVVVTGPNSGGKTRLLQAVGLAQVLGQAGLFVPAKRARLAWRKGLFVSLVHPVLPDQREGQLGLELVRIRRLFERMGFGDLILLDELCSGTNPSEGEQIAQLVISLLHRLEPQALITTHFLEFAARLAQGRPVPGLGFRQVELDPHLRPTFRFVPGVAKSSLAAQTAERLGVTREALEALLVEKTARRHPEASPSPPPRDKPVPWSPTEPEPNGSTSPSGLRERPSASNRKGRSS
ncbi:DNA mismatch repair protein [Myxococcota bacterium]